MKKLIIKTHEPEAVQHILWRESLIDGSLQYYPDGSVIGLFTAVVNYPDDLLSQSMTYWLAMAQGCGLIEEHQLR